MDDLREQPLAVLPLPTSISLSPDIITITDLLTYLRETLYTPVRSWPEAARVLADLSNRNGTRLSLIKNKSFTSALHCTSCTKPYNASRQSSDLGLDPLLSAAIWCSDGAIAQRLISPGVPERHAGNAATTKCIIWRYLGPAEDAVCEVGCGGKVEVWEEI
jgi:hypothetical protein